MRTCTLCKRELPDEQYTNRKGVITYTRCKECRYTQQKKSLAKSKAADMPWYNDWIIKDNL